MISQGASASLGSAPVALCAGRPARDRFPVQTVNQGSRFQFGVDCRHVFAVRSAMLCRRRVAKALRQRDEDSPAPRCALQSP